MIWTTIGLSLIYALLLEYWKNMSYLKLLPTSTLTIFTILVNQHIVQVTALKQLFWMLLMICSFLLTKATYLYSPCLTFLQHLTQLIILSLYTMSMLTLDLLILSCNGFHLIWLIAHTTSLYLITDLLLLLYTQVYLRVMFLALFFSPCILRLCSPLLTYTIHLLMTYNYRCLLPLMEYLCDFTLCSHVLVMSKLGQLRTCISLMTTRQNSCLSPQKELSISITYLLQSP